MQVLGIPWRELEPRQPILMLDENVDKQGLKYKKKLKNQWKNVCVITTKLLWMPVKAREGFNSSDAQPSLDK